jgi:DNA-binding PadR family transcriptional regulator
MTDSTPADLERALPLKPQWFHILLALSQQAQHGSGIVRAVLDQTAGKLRLWPATLYGSLDELAQLGWIEELTEPGERPEGESEKKRFFRLTETGKQILSAEAERLRSLAQTAMERLASAGPAA